MGRCSQVESLWPDLLPVPCERIVEPGIIGGQVPGEILRAKVFRQAAKQDQPPGGRVVSQRMEITDPGLQVAGGLFPAVVVVIVGVEFGPIVQEYPIHIVRISQRDTRDAGSHQGGTIRVRQLFPLILVGKKVLVPKYFRCCSINI